MTFLFLGWAVTLALCIFQMWRIRKLSLRINKLESAILGNRTGRSLPFESLEILSGLRRKAREWTSSENHLSLLTMSPAFIERLDNYISGILNSLPNMLNENLLEPRPPYSLMHTTHFVIFSSGKDELIKFPCISSEQAEQIVNEFTSKGIEAKWTAIQSSY